MIPDIRLMIVALLASVVAIGCGLGLFAAFRVNHEQFARAPNGSPLLQLAFVTPDSATDATAASFAVRQRMSTPASASAAATPTFDDASAMTPLPAANSSARQEAPQAPATGGTSEAALAPPADQSQPVNLTVQNTNTGPSAPSVNAAPIAKATKKLKRSRAAKLRRRTQPLGVPAAQPADQLGAMPQPAFQSAAPDPGAQTVRRRVVVRRRRLNNANAAATTSVPQRTAVGSTAAGPAAR